jgi:hypothetical protein
MIPGARRPDRMNAARDQIARQAEAENPGWAICHGQSGWTSTRARDARTERATSLPSLLALISIADLAGPRPSP